MAIKPSGVIGHTEIMAEMGHTGKFDLSADGAALIGKSVSTQIDETDFYGASSSLGSWKTGDGIGGIAKSDMGKGYGQFGVISSSSCSYGVKPSSSSNFNASYHYFLDDYNLPKSSFQGIRIGTRFNTKYSLIASRTGATRYTFGRISLGHIGGAPGNEYQFFKVENGTTAPRGWHYFQDNSDLRMIGWGRNSFGSGETFHYEDGNKIVASDNNTINKSNINLGSKTWGGQNNQGYGYSGVGLLLYVQNSRQNETGWINLSSWSIELTEV